MTGKDGLGPPTGQGKKAGRMKINRPGNAPNAALE